MCDFNIDGPWTVDGVDHWTLWDAVCAQYAAEVDGITHKIYGALPFGVLGDMTHPLTNREGLTFSEWYYAAGFTSPQNADQYKAWLQGEDPTEYRV